MRYLTFSERYFTPLYKLNYVEDAVKKEDSASPAPSSETSNSEMGMTTTTTTITNAISETSSKESTPLNQGVLADSQDHVKILLHSNGICVLTLAPSHPILTRGLTVDTVDFQVSKRVNRLQNTVKGKGKKGGQFFSDDKQVWCRKRNVGKDYCVCD